MNILAKGNSMLPTLKDGEIYNIELIEEDVIQIGDIIVYYVVSLPICHRIIEIFIEKYKRCLDKDMKNFEEIR